MMDADAFSAWVTALGRAWEVKDADAAAALFAEDATYQEDSFGEPMRGREAIRAYWADVPLTQEDIAFNSEVITVSGDLDRDGWLHRNVLAREGRGPVLPKSRRHHQRSWLHPRERGERRGKTGELVFHLPVLSLRSLRSLR